METLGGGDNKFIDSSYTKICISQIPWNALKLGTNYLSYNSPGNSELSFLCMLQQKAQQFMHWICMKSINLKYLGENIYSPKIWQNNKNDVSLDIPNYHNMAHGH